MMFVWAPTIVRFDFIQSQATPQLKQLVIFPITH